MAQVSQLLHKKSSIAAILIAGSASSATKDVIPRNNINKTEKGSLMGSVSDIKRMCDLFVNTTAIDIVKTFGSKWLLREIVLRAVSAKWPDTRTTARPATPLAVDSANIVIINYVIAV